MDNGTQELQASNAVLSQANQLTLVDVFISPMGGPNIGGQEGFCRSPKHEKIVSGGNHSGKTYINVMMGALSSIPEKDKYGKNTGWAINPYQRIGIPSQKILGWFSSHSSQVQKGTIQPVVDKILKPYFIKEPYMEDGAYKSVELECANIAFMSQSAGVQSYLGAKVDWAGLDEPHDKSIYNEVKGRIAMRKGYMWTTLTPVVDIDDIDAWSKSKNIDWMIEELIQPFMENPDNYPELDVFFIPLEENKYLADHEHIRRLYATLPPEERLVRLTGEFMGTAKRSLFGEDALIKLEAHIMEKQIHPEFGFIVHDEKEADDEYKFIFEAEDTIFPDRPRNGWMMKVWQHPIHEQLGIRPKYCMGIDAAEGKTSGDYSAVYVRRMDTGSIVAALHGYINETLLAYEVWKLGHYYSDGNGQPAMIAIETNNAGKTCLAHLLAGNPNLGITTPYPKNCLYRRPDVKHLQQDLHIPSSNFGWYETTSHRAYLLKSLRELFLEAYNKIDDGICLIPDRGLLAEAKHFVLDANKKYQALKGHHDDRIIAYGVSEMAVKQGSFRVPVYKPREKVVDDNKGRFQYKDGEIYINLGLDKARQKTNKQVIYK